MSKKREKISKFDKKITYIDIIFKQNYIDTSFFYVFIV